MHYAQSEFDMEALKGNVLHSKDSGPTQCIFRPKSKFK